MHDLAIFFFISEWKKPYIYFTVISIQINLIFAELNLHLKTFLYPLKVCILHPRSFFSKLTIQIQSFLTIIKKKLKLLKPKYIHK